MWKGLELPMPKMKTKRAAAKRYSLTGTQKIKIKRNNLRHILTKMSSGSKRDKRKAGFVHSADCRQAKRMLPYGA
ncbi:MAG: 50S ribosomal protein L35 [Bacteriovoracales bacterium]|nr:50S ribosomal protein L35 [Bacteriovoracales bacterium]